MKQQINDQAAQTDCELKEGNPAAINLPAAMQDGENIIPDQPDSDCQQDTVFNYYKKRFHLGKSIRSFFGDGFIEKRDQQQKGTDHDQIRHIKDAVHQQGMGFRQI